LKGVARLYWALARYMLRTSGRQRSGIRAGFVRRAALEAERDTWASPLTACSPSVYRVDDAFIARLLGVATCASPPLSAALRQGCVLHFTGTGETRHGPLASIELLLTHSPELGRLEHYIVDAPAHAAAYGDAMSFADQLWQELSPLLQARSGPCLFVGLSRGALAALELGFRAAVEQNKIVSVLAQSPPFVRPARMPPAIELIASCESLVTRSIAQLELFPSAKVQRRYVQLSKPIQTLLTASVLAELGLDDVPNQNLAMRDLLYDDPIASSLRSVREFAMLTRVEQAELSQFADKLGEVVTQDTRLSVAIAWGQNDPWTPAAANHALVEQAIARAGGSRAHTLLRLLPGVGHAFCREPGQPAAELQAITTQLIAWTEEKLRLAPA
jgi:pimeloyl-ACP methyl ester carboxylesterase